MEDKIQQKESDGEGMFFIKKDSKIVAELTYTVQDNGILTLDHTETDPEMTGKGLASKLVRHTVDYAREHDLKVDPLCGYAAKQFERHKEYQEIQVS